MSPVMLKTVFGDYGHTHLLRNGTLRPKGIEFEHVEVPSIINAFRRMVRGLEFDVSEMAITTYICARSFKKPFTGIPVFLSRGSFHGGIVYNTKSGVKTPKDLEGKKVGVNRGYTVTPGLWTRGVQTEYGVDLNKITWVLSGDEHVQEYTPPPNVIGAPQGRELADMLVSGEIAAAIGVGNVNSLDVKPLIPDARNVASQSLKRTGIYPINHMVVIKDSRLSSDPWIAEELFSAFSSAKQAYLASLTGEGQLAPPDQAMVEMRSTLGGDPLPYGVRQNRKALEAVLQYSIDQKIIAQKMSVEDLFTPNTRMLE